MSQARTGESNRQGAKNAKDENSGNKNEKRETRNKSRSMSRSKNRVYRAGRAAAGRGVRTGEEGLYLSVAQARVRGEVKSLAGERGLEPRLPDPESGVLPLHYSPEGAREVYSGEACKSRKNLAGRQAGKNSALFQQNIRVFAAPETPRTSLGEGSIAATACHPQCYTEGQIFRQDSGRFGTQCA